MKGRNLIAGTWVIAIAIISWSSFHQNLGMPQPVRLIKTSAVWTLLSVVGEAAPQVAGVMSLGMLAGLFLMETGNLGLVSGAQALPSQQQAQAQTAAISDLGSFSTGAIAA